MWGSTSACDLIVLPGYANHPGPITHAEAVTADAQLFRLAADTARRCGAFVCICGVLDEGEGPRNLTRLYGRDGAAVHTYYKQHLPPGETGPLAIDGRYTSRACPDAVVEAAGIRFGFLTCYDIYFSEHVEYLADQQPDILLFPAYQRGERADILEAQARLCALRCNSYVLRASYAMGEESMTGGQT